MVAVARRGYSGRKLGSGGIGMDRARLLALAIGLALAAPAAGAVTLQQIVGDSFSGSVDTLSFASFDPALGTLDRVNVSITGTLVLQASSQINVVSGPGGSFPSPIAVAATVTQSFTPIGINNRGFEFATSAQFLFNSVASGSGELVTFSTPFSYDFAFTALTDLIGFAIPGFSGPTIPPTSVIGLRGDFLDLAPPLDGEEIQILTQSQIGSLTGLLGGVITAGGAVLVTYVYTPPVVEVAEPEALALFGLTALGLCWCRRR